MAIRYYRALMSLEPDGSCGVVFPELPGCVSHGNDLNDALRMVTEALGMHITAMIEDGDAVPPALQVDVPLTARVDGRNRQRPWHRLVRRRARPGAGRRPVFRFRKGSLVYARATVGRTGL